MNMLYVVAFFQFHMKMDIHAIFNFSSVAYVSLERPWMGGANAFSSARRACAWLVARRCGALDISPLEEGSEFGSTRDSIFQ